MSISYEGKVAIVTGAGGGLGRSHALALAARGAKVVVNDLGGDVHGEGGSSSAAEAVVKEIEDAGGEAIAHGANVCDEGQVADMVKKTMDKWGRIDILINNAGVLRDKTFTKMDLADFKFVMDVHVMGTVTCTKAVWDIMREQAYGRIVMTTSSSGLYGNFGQSNYGAAKMAVVGFMNTLCLEGAKYNINVNCLAPMAATRMTEGLLPQAALDLSTPESVTAGLLTLCDDDAPNRTILAAGAGGYAKAVVYETEGIYLTPDEQTPENVRAGFDDLSNAEGQQELVQGGQQSMKFIGKAAAALGVKVG
ncbi:MAG: SDR family NAD(P)-dependent oxidoreductase [Kordiimonadaceae bacterium]|nr:SDR family NAD(P)-dependent oxidoreductase [Kordiimonadaceae bacterium]MBO6570018.1 SDR family NAD(P)-dependent oxidoreductase [Kordiimonadaceae bacterium]MBO6965885.1 SDR family NAD(P)-dependent oxidoreductase [Kordiimonadaceae bacterium]